MGLWERFLTAIGNLPTMAGFHCGADTPFDYSELFPCRINFARYSASMGDKLNLKQASSISFPGFLSGPYLRSSEIHLTAFLKSSPSGCTVVMVNILNFVVQFSWVSLLRMTSFFSKVQEKSVPFHETDTSSRMASSGSPRKASSRLSSKINGTGQFIKFQSSCPSWLNILHIFGFFLWNSVACSNP